MLGTMSRVGGRGCLACFHPAWCVLHSWERCDVAFPWCWQYRVVFGVCTGLYALGALSGFHRFDAVCLSAWGVISRLQRASA